MTKYYISLILHSLLFSLVFSSCVGYQTITQSSLITTKSTLYSDYPQQRWKKIPIYNDSDLLLSPYRVIAKITVTGNESTFDKGLIKEMRREAGKYQSDAIIFKSSQEVVRNSVNGFAIALNLASIFSQEPLDLDMGGEYTAYEYSGIAIEFLDQE